MVGITSGSNIIDSISIQYISNYLLFYYGEYITGDNTYRSLGEEPTYMRGMAEEQSQPRVVPPIPAPRLSLVQANSGKYYFTHISHLKTGLRKIARFSYTLSCL